MAGWLAGWLYCPSVGDEGQWWPVGGENIRSDMRETAGCVGRERSRGGNKHYIGDVEIHFCVDEVSLKSCEQEMGLR